MGAIFGAEALYVQTQATAADVYGNQARDWTDPDERLVYGDVQPAASTERHDDRTRDQTAQTFRVFLPAGDPVTAANRIRRGADVLEIEGEPQHWTTLLGAPSHVEVTAVLVKG